VGVIRQASVEPDGVHIQGWLFDRNQPDMIQAIRANASRLGLSFEISDIGVAAETDHTMTLSALEWTGCSILAKATAAYTSSWIRLD